MTTYSCSFLRFALRAFIQFVLLTPKPAIFPDTPQSRPIGMVIGTNILCFILHAIFSRPEAGEATRGYLHGGLAMDLIGQKGPSSKLRLLLLDVLVLGLQLINLAVLLLKRRASAAAASGSAATNSNTVTATSAQVPAAAAGGGQTLDFEERGQHRSDHEAVDIELQTLNPSGSAAQRSSTTTTAPAEDPSPDVEDDDGSREQTALLSSLDQADEPDSDTHLFSAFNTGEIQIADLNIPRMVREQMIEYYHQTPVDTAATNTAAEAATARRNRLAARLGFGNDGFGFRIRIGSQTVGF